MTISYQVERLEHDTGEDLFLVKRYQGGVSHEDDEVLELLRADLDMNAQGLGMWLDKCPESATA
jgi:hypothetical protein